MGYYIDLSTISLKDYKDKLATAYLPPSRKILREKRDERFDYFSKYGIRNVKELLQTLKNQGKFDELSKVNCLKGDYLKILLRELKSMLPKPNKLSEFAGINSTTITKLEKIGIKNTLKLFERVKTPEMRKQLSVELEMDETDILELTMLTDLSRIKWVGTTFARILFDIGVDSAEAASHAEPEDLHIRINKIIKERKLYKGTVSLNDVGVFIQAAGDIPIEITI